MTMTTPLETEELVKPPIGLRLRIIAEYRYLEDRIAEIEEAVQRYTEAGLHKGYLPTEWLEEKTELEHKLSIILCKVRT